MAVSRSTVSALIVLLMGIFIFQSMVNTDWIQKIVTTYKYYTMIGAIIIILFRNQIMDKIGLS